MIAVDTNVLAYLFIQGEHTASALAVLHRDAEWVAPRLWRSEFRNVLALYLRRHILSLPDALDAFGQAERLLDGGEHEVPTADVLRLVTASPCSAYDCEFVALAQALRVPLVTADRRVREAFPSVAVSPATFAV